MIRFTRLKLHGFKSFVDSAELTIEPGMTGIVGPNGCGKSNLVEALRWVMGESSARLMRGAEMDDVIFGGTSARPPRSLAEVSLFLDNESRSAPVAFNDYPEIEVTRRIERGMGSIYRCNGREVRARDVQILFADSSSGARSTAMVTQGKIGELIAAKPSQRRVLLEEAAGIAGLHARRHEAELRLKAAESNLDRLGDVMTGLEAHVTSLKRQAKQAERYRTVSGSVRQTEAVVLFSRWGLAVEALDQAKQSLIALEAAVAEATSRVTEATTAHLAAIAGLPPLRAEEAKLANQYNQLKLAIEQNQAEERRVAAARAQAERQLQHVADDTSREQARMGDAEVALARLAAEEAVLAQAALNEDAVIAVAAQAVAVITHDSAQAEQALAEITARLAAEQAAEQTATQRVREAEDRLTRLQTRQRDGLRALAELERQAAQGRSLSEAEQALARIEAEAAAARLALAEAESAEARCRAAQQSGQEAVQRAQSLPARLTAEIAALRSVLSSGQKGNPARSVLDDLTVAAGYEKALAAALGDDLAVPADTAAAAHWAVSGQAPQGVSERALLHHVTGSAAPLLARRLAHVWLVVDRATGDALRNDLVMGQRLVSRDGDLWRWDGFVRRAGAPTATAVRLEQRNRLTQLEEDLIPALATLTEAQSTARLAQQTAERAMDSVQSRRQHSRADEERLTKARGVVAEVTRENTASQGRMAGLVAQNQIVTQDLIEAESALAAVRSTLATVVAQRSDPRGLEQARVQMAEARAALAQSRAEHDRLSRDAADRHRQRERLAHETGEWQKRLAAFQSSQNDLAQRRAEATEAVQQLADRPAALALERHSLLDEVSEIEAARQTARDTLAGAEASASQSERALREAERTLASQREARVRAEAVVQQGDVATRQQAGLIAERLDCTPLQARAVAGLSDGADPPSLPEAEGRLSRLLKERESMGPVNLRAEAELSEIAGQLVSLTTERDDLTAAIARLRQGINELNREGRQRLTASFEKVDTEFRRLFVRLFGGGRAHLALTESDDPLEAGLEIYASPPGKRLQVLSLLSGGEQAMTALALLFAVFLVNPAPVCVLDEVDAPLDDANVDRFCTLLSDISQASGQATRFLVVTHHRMTMARMDRLYGVTMAERGVSKLVSVDLREADLFVEAL